MRASSSTARARAAAAWPSAAAAMPPPTSTPIRTAGRNATLMTAAALVLALLFVLALAPQASASWGAEQIVADRDGSLSDIRTATAANGVTVAVWVRYDSNAGTYSVEMTRVQPSGTVEPVRVLSGPSAQLQTASTVAVQPDGTASVLWYQRSGAEPNHEDRTMMRRVAADGTPAAQTLALSLPGERTYGVNGVVDASGVTTVVWRNAQGIRYTRRAADGNPLPPFTHGSPEAALSDATANATWPDLIHGNDGGVWVRWSYVAGTMTNQMRRIAPDGTLGSIVDATTGAPASVSFPHLAPGPDGGAVLVWSTNSGVGPQSVQAVRISANGTRGALHTLSATELDDVRPRVATAPDGSATVVWASEQPDGSSLPRMVQLRADDSITPVTDLAAYQAGDTFSIELETGSAAHGTMTVAMTHYPDVGNARVRALRIAPDGTVSPTVTLSAAPETSQYSGQVSVSPGGRATALWTSSKPNPNPPPNSLGMILHARQFTPPAPTVALTMPEVGRAVLNVPTAMSAVTGTPFDPATLQWSFGDGATGAGSWVQHTYGSAGQYSVTAVATDPLGQQGSATAPLEVFAPARSVQPPARPKAPASELRDGTLRLHELKLRRSGKKACPKHATIQLTGRVRARSGKRMVTKTAKLSGKAKLAKSGKDCLASATLKLRGQIKGASKVTLTLRGKGLRTSKRTVKAQRSVLATKTRVTLSKLPLRATDQAACPAEATVTVSGATKATRRHQSTQTVKVELAPVTGCRTSAKIKLTGKLRTIKKLSVTVSGSGLKNTKQTITR